jgi:hypothetical protein
MRNINYHGAIYFSLLNKMIYSVGSDDCYRRDGSRPEPPVGVKRTWVQYGVAVRT